MNDFIRFSRWVRWLPLYLLVGVLLLPGTLPAGYADDSSSNTDDWSGFQEAPDYYPPNRATEGAYPVQGAPLQAPPEPQPKRSFLGRIFNPIRKQASPPINQLPKAEKEKPRETVALPDPLIRLGKGIRYNDKEIPPGLYLVSAEPDPQGQGMTLNLIRRQDILLSIPAFVGGGTAPIEIGTQPLPGPPAGKKGDAPAPPEATAHTESSLDGRTMILVYEKGGRQYTSVPVDISAAYRLR